MTKDIFNGSAQKEEMTREKIESALELFLNNHALKEFGVTPYVSEDLKTFGVKCLSVGMAEHASIHLCFLAGAKTRLSEKSKKGEVITFVETDSVSSSFFNLKEKKSLVSRIAEGIIRLRK